MRDRRIRILHYLLLAAGMATVAATTAQAQSDFADRKATSSLTIGLGFAPGASMSIDAPELWKVNPVFAWRAGIDATYPLTPVISASLGFGLDSRATKVYWYQDKSMWELRHVNYFHITPGFQFNAFFLGINLGFPMGGVRRWQNFSGAGENSTELDNDRNLLLTMIEPRIGAVIPLVDEDIGWLGLTIGAGYNINDMSESSTFLPGAFAKQNAGTQTVSLHIGATWQFAIPGTSRQESDL